VERKLAAILCADVFGYSRLMGADEEATLRALTANRKLIDSEIDNHHGRFVNSAGDSVLAEFASVVEAVNCAVDIQTGLKAENASLPPERRMEFRIGVNLGDVMVEGEQIHGDGVNVAARVESLAEPGGIWISGIVHEQVRDKLALAYEDRGEQTVKNIARPVHVWRILLSGATPAPQRTQRVPPKYRRAGAASMVGLAIVIATIVVVQHLSFKPQTTHASIPPQAKPALPLPSIPSIAVLPFTNLSGDPKQEYFSDGISVQLINNLSRLSGLFVIARNSSFAYKGKAIKESEIGNELGVKYLLEGSVHKESDQVRIGVELVDAGSGTDEWTAQYDRPLKDIFAVQDEIVSKVVTTLGLIFKLDEMHLPRPGGIVRPTENLEAFDDLLRAAEIWSMGTKEHGREDAEKAAKWLEKAIALDPKYGQAYSFLGWLHMTASWNQWGDSRTNFEQAAELGQKALALDESDSDALSLLCQSDWMRGRFDEAVADGRRAVAINPNYANGYQALADTLIIYGDPVEAISAAQKALRLDPTGKDLHSMSIGFAYVEMGRYTDAIPILKQALTAFPNIMVTHLDLIQSYVELGRQEDAQAAAAELMRMSPQFTIASVPLVRGEARNKRAQDDWRKAGLK